MLYVNVAGDIYIHQGIYNIISHKGYIYLHRGIYIVNPARDIYIHWGYINPLGIYKSSQGYIYISTGGYITPARDIIYPVGI